MLPVVPAHDMYYSIVTVVARKKPRLVAKFELAGKTMDVQGWINHRELELVK